MHSYFIDCLYAVPHTMFSSCLSRRKYHSPDVLPSEQKQSLCTVALTCLDSAEALSGPSFLTLGAGFITHVDVFADPGKHFTKICEDPRGSLIVFLHIVSPTSTTARTPGSHTSESPSPFLIPAHEGTS